MMKHAKQYESFQIYVSSSDNTDQTTYQIGLSGKYRLKLKGIATVFSSAPTDITIELRSPQLTTSKGNCRYFNLVYPATRNDNSFAKDYAFDPQDFNGYMNLQIVDKSTLATPTNFTAQVLTFEAERVMDYPYEI